jgi:hypothetical protein
LEDIVAIKATDSSGKHHFFLTWGRAFDRVGSKPLLTAVRPALSQFGLSKIRRLEVCSTLQEASDQPYFFEALFAFAQKPAPSGKARRAWSAVRRKQIAAGKEIYYLGTPVT